MSDHSSPSEHFDRTSAEYRNLVAAGANGAVLFVGAGSSCRVGYPAWGTLLSRLSEAAKQAEPAKIAEVDRVRGADGLLQASTYRRILGETRYFDELTSAFASRMPPHDAFHEALIGIPFRHVLTTNYDGVLQSAHRSVSGNSADSFDVDEWDRLSAFRQDHGTDHRQYVHVHGSIGRPQSIVLCQEDYDARYVNENRAKAFLYELLVGQRVVFVGFGLNDFDLQYILRHVAGSLGLSEPRHFALLPRPDSPDEEQITRENLTGKYRVQPVFFESSSGDYSSLEPLILALNQDVQIESESRGQQHRFLPIDAISDLLEDLFQDQPDLRDSVAQQLPGLFQRFAVPMESQSAGGDGGSDIDRAIDTVFALVDKGLPDQAIAEYEAIRVRHQSELTDKQRYRIDANIGNALYSKGDAEAASESYLRAVGHYRESRDAQGLEIMAHFLQADLVETQRLAESLCRREPEFGRARSLWVRAQPDNADFHAVEAEVPESLRSEAEVAMSLSDFARRTSNLAACEQYARAAVAASPDWPDAMSALGGALVTAERSTASFEIDRGMVPENPDRVAEAEHLFSTAIECTPDTDPMGELAGLYFNRSVARRFQGNILGAEEDLHEAFRRDPTDPTIVLVTAMKSESPADVAKLLAAIDELPVDCPEKDQLKFARASLLLSRRQSGDLDRALDEIAELSRRLGEIHPPALRSDIVQLGLRIYSELNRLSAVQDFVEAVPKGALAEHAFAVLRGRSVLLADGPEKAADLARDAIRLLDNEINWFDRRQTALLAQECGLHSEAVPIWESLLESTSTGSDTVHLVRCAYSAGDWKKVLTVCSRARTAGHLKREHVEAEVEVLANSREPDRAIARLREWMRTHPGDRRAQLRLSQLTLQHGRPDLAVFDEDRLPRVDELVNAGEGPFLVYVLRRGPAPQRALDVAYELYRRFPDHIAAHRTLMSCVFDPSTTQLEIARPTVSGKGTAVCIRRDGEQPRWVYVEDGPDPAVTRGEYSESHELVVALWAKKAGDRFDFQGHSYTVVAVENKALRRVHEIMETYEENFPTGPLLRRVKVPVNPPADAPIEEQLGEMMTELERYEQHRELLESMYTGDQIPLASFARLLGRPVFDAVRYLAFQPMRGVRADRGDPQSWTSAIASLRDAPDVILDSTVLASAFVLDLLDDLPSFGLKLVVPRAVVDEIRDLSLNAASPRTPRATLGLHQGRLFFHETSPEETAREVEAMERILSFIREHCEVVGGEATLELAADLRQQLEGMVGEAATDALALAKTRNGVLWTDDLGLQLLANELNLDVPCVWTQAVLAVSRDTNQISAADYTRAVGQLVVRGYAFVRLSARAIADLLASVEWRTDTLLGAAVVRLVQEVGLMNPRNRLIAAVAFLLVWGECPQRRLARDLIVSILEGIGRPGSGPLFAAFIYRGDGMRGFSGRNLSSLRQMLRSWRSGDGEFKPGRRKNLAADADNLQP